MPSYFPGTSFRIPRASGLRPRVGLLFALFLVAMLALAGYQAYLRRQDSIQRATERVSETALLIAGEQHNTVTYAEQFVGVLADTRDVREFAANPRCSQFLAEKLSREPRFANIAIVALNGDLVCSAVPTPGLVNIKDRDYFNMALTASGPVIGKATVGRASGKWNLPFATAVRDAGGHVVSVFLVSLDLGWLGSRLERGSYATSSNARLGLISDDGMVLAREPDLEKWVGRDASNTAFFSALKAHGGTGSSEAIGFDGTPRIYGFAPFAETLAGPIHLWVGISQQSVVQGVERQFAWALLGALLVLLVAFGLAWIGTERLVLRPVLAISDAARRLAGGDPHARTGLTYTKDELGQLARSFDQMADSLASTNRLLQANEEIRLLNSTLERRVQERTTALEAANKELEAFAYSVSHDLRAPLRTIDGFSKILEEDYSVRVDEEGRDSLHRVRAAAQKMGHLIDDLLKLSRLSRSEMMREQVDLGELAESIAAELRAADPGRNVVFKIAPGLIARGDKTLLRVLLDNLLGNAWKFTSKHPRARIEVGGTDKDGEQVYFVRDDGAGFDMAHVNSLFAPFQRLHGMSEFPGTGIGLATVRRIVQRHGGRAWAEGAVEKGATFYFTLPAGPLEAQAAKREVALV